MKRAATLPGQPPAVPFRSKVDAPLKLSLARLAHGISPASVGMAYADWWIHLLASPGRQAELAAAAVDKCWRWPLAGPVSRDKRFSAPQWQLQPYTAMAQAFLAQEQWWRQAMTGVRGVSAHHEDVVSFTTRQWTDPWSPSNFVLTNPEVMGRTVATGGWNLVSGAANWWRDAMAVLGDRPPRGVEAFRPGLQVAITPGRVVMRNRLVELIQYEPATPRVHAEPLLIVPSWIMKYYILDLTPADSLVKYLVGRGHTVFMVSWNNPDGADRDLGLDDYLELGVMASLRAVRAAVPRRQVHAAGYCLGGTLLAIAAAALARDGRSPLRTASLLAAQTDFHEPGELGLFIDESQIAFLEDLMAGPGYLDGRQMAGAFQLINSKDLVWSKLVHEYLMGAQTPVTALRAWNADATRLPARMHSEYLRRLYLHNDLAEGRYLVGGRPVKLSDLAMPLFVVATERDHVSPWHSVYKVNRLARAPIEFVLASGGHNVGIVSPPAGPQAQAKAGYRASGHPPGAAPGDPQAWLRLARERKGSWWPCWSDWLVRHGSRAQVAARAVKGLTKGEDSAAPGTYVHRR